jgi:hypothetical protein
MTSLQTIANKKCLHYTTALWGGQPVRFNCSHCAGLTAIIGVLATAVANVTDL